jgi:hypothetical protein
MIHTYHQQCSFAKVGGVGVRVFIIVVVEKGCGVSLPNIRVLSKVEKRIACVV